MTFKGLNGLAPSYLSDLVTRYIPRRLLDVRYNLRIIRVKFAYHFRINYDLNLETAEFLELGLCDFGETLFSVRH